MTAPWTTRARTCGQKHQATRQRGGRRQGPRGEPLAAKTESEIASERAGLQSLVEAEHRIVETRERRGVGWPILRPTLIYCEGQDRNISMLARLIRRFRVRPFFDQSMNTTVLRPLRMTRSSR